MSSHALDNRILWVDGKKGIPKDTFYHTDLLSLLVEVLT